MNDVKIKMWKTFIYVAAICTAIQIGLFISNLSFNGCFNWVVFIQAVGWALWLCFCSYKLITLKKK